MYRFMYCNELCTMLIQMINNCNFRHTTHNDNARRSVADGAVHTTNYLLFMCNVQT